MAGIAHPEDQSEVIAFLGAPSSYPGTPARVERIDTHGAIVFLAGDAAYKIKRAVRLAYLDFSTLEKRRAACEREIEINRLTAPQIYKSVVPVTRDTDGTLTINGDGEVIEWAVSMRRFDQEDLLDRMAVEGRLPVDLMVPLAAHIADYHDKAPILARDGSSIPAFAGVVENVIGALQAAEERLGADGVCEAAAGLEAALSDHRPLMMERAARGFVRRCHGDLHLRNIVLVDGKPILFDAIEFDESIATVDVLYDLAFLMMDLWHRNDDLHANTVLNRYLWRSGTEAHLGALGLLPLFLSVRAGVRAMVALDSLPHAASRDRERIVAEAREYLDLILRFLRPLPARLIAVGGLSGSGKSTLAAALAPSIGAAPGAYHLRSDVERKLMFAVPLNERLGKDAYTLEASQRVYAALEDKARDALRTGHSVVVDAVSAQEGERHRLRRLAEDAGARFAGLWLTASETAMTDRVTRRRGDASDADAAVVKRQLGYAIGDMDWTIIDAGGSPETTLALAREALALKSN